MGSYESIIKIEEIKKRVEEGDFLSAQKVVDTMDIRKIKNTKDLNLIAMVYEENGKYEEALEIFLKIYEKVKTRKALYQLIEIQIKLNNIEDAEFYLIQYRKLAPDDFNNDIFRFKIGRLKGESYEYLIGLLEELKKTEYIEKWAYELAKLYYKAGMEEKCIRECSDIELWFGEGTYVEKAKILRSYYSEGADKDKIMEEIKKRAQVINSKADTDTLPITPLPNNVKEVFDASNPAEELCLASDFKLHEDTQDFEYDLKKDVQLLLENEQPIESSDFVATEFLYDQQGSAMEQGSRAPEEKYPEEEDIKLKELFEGLNINPYEIFGNFLHVPAIKKQLVKSLEAINNDCAKDLMMIITGAKGSGKTALAKDMALFFYESDKLKSSKLAKIKADNLNSVDILSKKDTLRDCCLVIESASELKHSTIESLLELYQQLQGNLAIIFEEDKKNLNQLFRECPKLMELLKNRIHIPQYTLEDFIGFAYSCATIRDYQIDPKAEQVFTDRLSQIVKQSEQERQLELIYDMMQAAMNAADSRLGYQRTAVTSKGRLQDVEAAALIEEDFSIRL